MNKVAQLTINSRQEREIPLHPPLLQEAINFFCRARALQHLSVQLLLLDHPNRHTFLHAHLRAPKVPTATTTSDQIRDACTLLCKRLGLHPFTPPLMRRYKTGMIFAVDMSVLRSRGVVLTPIAKERLAKLDHLKQADAHDGGLGIVAPAQPGDKACGQRDDVLQRAGERDSRDVGDEADVEIGALKEGFEGDVVEGWKGGWQRAELDFRLGRKEPGGFESWRQSGQVDMRGRRRRPSLRRPSLRRRRSRGPDPGRRAGVVHGRWIVGDRRLGELLLRDFVGDVSSGQGTAVDAQFRADHLREERDGARRNVHALDARDAAGVGQDVALHLGAEVRDELVRQVEDEDGGVAHGVDEGRVGDEVGGQGNGGQILDVFVERVDEGGELLGLGAELRRGIVMLGVFGEADGLFENPHLDGGLEEVAMLRRVFSDDLGDGRAPSRLLRTNDS